MISSLLARCGCKKRQHSLTSGIVFFILAITLSTFTYADSGASSYKLGPGDKINITVFGEEDLSFDVIIGDSSTISFPFLGEIVVSTFTPKALSQHIADRLRGDYLVNPEVNVALVEYRPFFVNGYVTKPGGYQFRPGMTVRKAISLAGGFEDRANRDKLFVVRNETTSEEPVPITLDGYIYPGDVVTVGRSFF